MKKINEMSVKELREVAKGYNVAGRWDMTKAQLVEAIEKIENEKSCCQKGKEGSQSQEGIQQGKSYESSKSFCGSW